MCMGKEIQDENVPRDWGMLSLDRLTKLFSAYLFHLLKYFSRSTFREPYESRSWNSPAYENTTDRRQRAGGKSRSGNLLDDENLFQLRFNKQSSIIQVGLFTSFWNMRMTAKAAKQNTVSFTRVARAPLIPTDLHHEPISRAQSIGWGVVIRLRSATAFWYILPGSMKARRDLPLPSGWNTVQLNVDVIYS